MRFINGGPDVPNQLVADQEMGEVLFVCGAGVSATAGLPLFRGLVERVYAELREDWRTFPAEREAMDLFQYDRALRSLERRLGALDHPRSQGMRERIRAAIRVALSPLPGANLANHGALLNLSRDAEGRIRIVTTNFDTLFERAWSSNHPQPLASHAGPGMPRPRAAAFEGVLHLHGRLGIAEEGLPETEIVLTSAEFGDAYLRSGWASRYVYDLVRTHVLVLFGYQANDPPMRYLLEALESDRERYPDLRQVYAFDTANQDEDALIAERWRAKGVVPIVYRSGPGDDHARLYETLLAWSRYAEDPSAWRRDRLRVIADINPTHMTDNDLKEVTDLLGHQDAERILDEVNPSSVWFPVLQRRGVFGPDRASPGPWIGRRIDDQQIVRAVVDSPPIDERTLWHIKRAIEARTTTIPADFRKAWRLILRTARSQELKRVGAWYEVASRVAARDIDYEVCKAVADTFRPRLHLRKPLYSPELVGTEYEPKGLEALVRIEFEPRDHPPPYREVLKSWPCETQAEALALGMLSRALDESLEEALDAGFLDGLDRSSWDVPSVAAHSQNEHRLGFLPIVRLIAELWERVARSAPEDARALANIWGAAKFALPQRLYLHALSVPNVFTAEDAAVALMRLDDKAFWLRELRRESMRLMAERWNNFSEGHREAVARRIAGGIPRSLFADDAFNDEDQWRSIRDRAVFVRLARIAAAGGTLDPSSTATLVELRNSYPVWISGPGDRDDFGSWSSSGWGPRGEPNLLKEVPEHELVGEAIRLERERPFEQGEIWRLLCEADPERALRGVRAEAKLGHWDASIYRGLLWAATKVNDQKLQNGIAELLLRTPDEPLSEFAPAAAGWLREQRETLTVGNGAPAPVFLNLWDRLAGVVYVDDGVVQIADEDDTETEAINRPGGELAWTLVAALDVEKPERGAGLGASFEPRFVKLAQAPGRAGLLARVYIARVLPIMDYVAPEWVAEHFVSRFALDHSEAMPLWRSYLGGNPQSVGLFNALKVHFLALFRNAAFSRRECAGLVNHLMHAALWRRQPDAPPLEISPNEVRRALTEGPPEVRHRAAWTLWRWMDEKDEERYPESKWRELIGPFFREIWPMDVVCRDERISHYLTLMALECGEAFPEAVDAIVDVLVPHDVHSVESSMGLNDSHAGLAESHPRALLQLLNAVIDPEHAGAPRDLGAVLARIAAGHPDVIDEASYRRLRSIARRLGA